MINYQKLWSSITKTLRILCKSSKEFIISKSNLEHWEDSVEPIIWLLFYLVLSYSISFTSITSQDQPLFVLEAAWPLPSARSTELTDRLTFTLGKQAIKLTKVLPGKYGNLLDDTCYLGSADEG